MQGICNKSWVTTTGKRTAEPTRVGSDNSQHSYNRMREPVLHIAESLIEASQRRDASPRRRHMRDTVR